MLHVLVDESLIQLRHVWPARELLDARTQLCGIKPGHTIMVD